MSFLAVMRGIAALAEALVIEGGVGTRLGFSSVHFLKPGVAPTVWQSRKPLTFRWSSPEAATARCDLSVEAGVLTSSQAGGAICR